MERGRSTQIDKYFIHIQNMYNPVAVDNLLRMITLDNIGGGGLEVKFEIEDDFLHL